MREPISHDDYRQLAKRRLPKMVFDFVEGGVEDESCLVRNTLAFNQTQFHPKKLINVSKRSQACALWGRNFGMPVFVAPTGLNGILRPNADAMLARAAARAGIPFALSTASNMSIEEIADISDGERWFQLYIINRDIADVLCDRALAAGYEALILTVDVPVNGYRERDIRNGFGVPIRYSPRTILDGVSHLSWSLDFFRNGVPEFRNFTTLKNITEETTGALMRREMDASIDFDYLARLRDRWPKKLIVKGLARPEDVAGCAAAGVDAVILSNHGGRQLDGAVASLDTVAACASAVEIPVFVDSGVRRGADVLKAICLGASMVGLGRTLLYAVAAAGEEGVTRSLSIIKDEMDRAQAILGAPQISDLDASFVSRPE